MNNKDTFTVIWDSGASMCVSPDKKDFIGPISKLPKPATIQAISNNLRIEGAGKVRWSMLDSKGNLRHLQLPCCCTPKLNQRLLSTSTFAETYPDCEIFMKGNAMTVKKGDQTINVFVNSRNNLPVSTCFRKEGLDSVAANLGESVVSLQNQNLSEPQKEPL